jgi:methylated-DNA-[protein]-cysteine S-methyltransferase
MINFNSAIALYGFQDIPLDLEAKTNDLGIQLISVPHYLDKTNLGSQLRELVNRTSALLIFETDEKLHTIVQFYFAANKKVFFISEEEDGLSLPKGIKVLPNTEEVLDALLKVSEKAFIDSKIGKLELRFNAFGLTYLKSSKKNVSTTKLSKQAQKVNNQLESYLDGKRKSFSLKVCLKGTEFQRRVWNRLAKIPYGQTCSYGDLAKKLGDKKASRAVGLANSKNPIWIAIPCHRVLSKDGDLTGYAGGLKLKQSLLDLESKQMSLF